MLAVTSVSADNHVGFEKHVDCDKRFGYDKRVLSIAVNA